MNPIILMDNYVVDFIWNTEKNSFARIYKVDLVKGGKNFIEVGTIVTYFDGTSAEVVNPHWQAECYLEAQHMTEGLIDALTACLIKNTQCKEPLLVNVNQGNRRGGKYRTLGKLTATD